MQLLEPLARAGADLDAAESALGEAPLHAACRHGHLKAVSELLRLGASPDALTATRESALCVASRRGMLDVMNALLAAGARVNCADENGETPLMKVRLAAAASAEALRARRPCRGDLGALRFVCPCPGACPGPHNVRDARRGRPPSTATCACSASSSAPAPTRRPRRAAG